MTQAGRLEEYKCMVWGQHLPQDKENVFWEQFPHALYNLEKKIGTKQTTIQMPQAKRQCAHQLSQLSNAILDVEHRPQSRLYHSLIPISIHSWWLSQLSLQRDQILPGMAWREVQSSLKIPLRFHHQLVLSLSTKCENTMTLVQKHISYLMVQNFLKMRFRFDHYSSETQSVDKALHSKREAFVPLACNLCKHRASPLDLTWNWFSVAWGIKSTHVDKMKSSVPWKLACSQTHMSAHPYTHTYIHVHTCPHTYYPLSTNCKCSPLIAVLWHSGKCEYVSCAHCLHTANHTLGKEATQQNIYTHHYDQHNLTEGNTTGEHTHHNISFHSNHISHLFSTTSNQAKTFLYLQ